ncbi:MAG: hypothetical protein K0U98_00965 [Deltaproteobacteria bacterium]|nr:hypothetical protein [Deltaproteobacteria bacterium]
MSQEAPQNLSTHRKFVPLYHFVVLPILAINFLRALWSFFRGLGHGFHFGSLMAVLMAFCFVAMGLFLRLFALKAQDRVIRLEERLRLQTVLPEELRSRIGEIDSRDFVGLRFASDEQLPELVGQVLNGSLKGQEQIKKAIKTWRPDHFRL